MLHMLQAFSLRFNDFQRLPAIPCNMNATCSQHEAGRLASEHASATGGMGSMLAPKTIQEVRSSLSPWSVAITGLRSWPNRRFYVRDHHQFVIGSYSPLQACS